MNLNDIHQINDNFMKCITVPKLNLFAIQFAKLYPL